MAHPIRALVPFVHVSNVPESIAFYEKLGMTVGNTFVPPDATEPAWAWLQSGIAQLMLAKASEPVGDIKYPFFAPRGEFRITDPDGYVLMITHT